MTREWIRVEGARTHNLKNITVEIPKNALVAFTGVSGSDKSSLAIDTIHATSQQWYLEGLSPFVRKFLVPDDRPDVDAMTGLGASLASTIPFSKRVRTDTQDRVASLGARSRASTQGPGLLDRCEPQQPSGHHGPGRSAPTRRPATTHARGT